MAQLRMLKHPKHGVLFSMTKMIVVNGKRAAEIYLGKHRNDLSVYQTVTIEDGRMVTTRNKFWKPSGDIRGTKARRDREIQLFKSLENIEL